MERYRFGYFLPIENSILSVLHFSCIQVYVNALGLLLRIDVRGHKNCIEDRIMVLADIFEDEVIELYN